MIILIRFVCFQAPVQRTSYLQKFLRTLVLNPLRLQDHSILLNINWPWGNQEKRNQTCKCFFTTCFYSFFNNITSFTFVENQMKWGMNSAMNRSAKESLFQSYLSISCFKVCCGLSLNPGPSIKLGWNLMIINTTIVLTLFQFWQGFCLKLRRTFFIFILIL